MAKISFAKAKTETAVPATAPTPQTAAASPPATATSPGLGSVTAPVTATPEPQLVETTVVGNDNETLAVDKYADAPPPAFYDGEQEEGFDEGDLVLPRLAIVQKVGDLSNVYPGGSIILGGQLVLAEPGKEMNPSGSIRVVVLGIQPTCYAEKLEGGARGNYFRTQEEVVKANGTLDWNESKRTEKQLYQRVALAMLAIEQPANLDGTAFPYAVDGKNYALTLYTMKGVAYTNAARHFKSARKMGHLRDEPTIKRGYRHGIWTLQSQLRKYGSNYAYAPVVKAAGPTSEAFRAGVLELLKF